MTTEIRAHIGHDVVPRSAVRQWESRRARVVLGKLRARLGHRGIAEILDGTDIAARPADIESQRATLLALKTGLGPAGIYALLARELAISERIARLAVRASGGRRALSTVTLVAPGVSATAFEAWFNGLNTADSTGELVGACPDHYLLRGLPDGRHEVVETTGGSPMPTQFTVDYICGDMVAIPVLPDYRLQIAGQARLDDGLVIGEIRHQFRDIDGSMEARLGVAFPRVFPRG